MYYPKRLLPKPDYKVLSREEINCNHFLCRRVDINLLKDETGKLSPNAVDDVEYLRLSTNIIPPTLPEDIHLIVTSDRIKTKYWEAGSQIPKCKDIEFIRSENTGHFFFKIEHIQEFKGTIKFTSKKKEFNALVSTDFISRIVHKPMVYIYYHYESLIEFPEFENVPAKSFGKNTYKAAITHILRDRLIEIAVFSLPSAV